MGSIESQENLTQSALLSVHFSKFRVHAIVKKSREAD